MRKTLSGKAFLALATVLHAPALFAQDAPQRLEPISSIGTLTPSAPLEQAFAVSLLDRAAMDETATHSTPDFFHRVTGVYMQKTNLGGGSPFIRGFTGKQVLILVDGVRLNNSFYRSGPHQYLNTLDPDAIGQIEVLRGARSVIYGSDALGGVINIHSRPLSADGPLTLRGALTTDTATNGESGSLRLMRPGAVDFQLGLSGKNLGELEAGSPVGRQSPTGYSETSGDLSLGRSWGEARLRLSHQFLRANDVPKTNEVTLGSSAQFDYAPQERSLTQLDYRSSGAMFDSLRFNLSYNLMEEGEVIRSKAAPNTQSFELTEVQTPGLLVQVAQEFGSHRLSYGADAYFDRYDTRKESHNLTTGVVTATNPGTPDNARYDSLGLFVQDEWNTSGGGLVGGLRYARYDTEGRVANQQLSLSTDRVTGSLHGYVSTAPGWSLVGGIEQGFRAPNMEDFFARVDFLGTLPNTDLKPERSLGYELGFKHESEGLSAEFIAFVTRYRDLINRVTVSPGVAQNQNVNRARIHGFEFALEADPQGPWSWGMTSTYTYGLDSKTGAPLRRIPPWFLTGWLRGDINPQLWGEVELRTADRQDRLAGGDISDPRIGPRGTPGYAIWNFSLGWKPTPKQQFLLTGENLTDRVWKTHGSGLFEPGRALRLAWRGEWGSR